MQVGICHLALWDGDLFAVRQRRVEWPPQEDRSPRRRSRGLCLPVRGQNLQLVFLFPRVVEENRTHGIVEERQELMGCTSRCSLWSSSLDLSDSARRSIVLVTRRRRQLVVVQISPAGYTRAVWSLSAHDVD